MKRAAKKTTRRKGADKKPIESYDHKDKKRANDPPAKPRRDPTTLASWFAEAVRAGIVVAEASEAGLPPWRTQIGAIHGEIALLRLSRVARLATIAA